MARAAARCSGIGALLALIAAAVLVTVGRLLARHYIGKRLIAWADAADAARAGVEQIYGTIKQVDEAFTGNKNSFKTVVLVEYPRAGIYSVGFITSEQQGEVQQKTKRERPLRFHADDANPHGLVF
jgi:uncharacterized membrane protein